MTDTIKILTYNIHHGEGADGVVDLDRIADVILAESPSIVTLQEVDRFWTRSGMADQPREIARLLDMEVVYEANLIHEPDAHSAQRHEYGLATLSRHPILQSQHHSLPVSDGWEERGVLVTHIDIPKIGTIAIVNVHLQSNANGDRFLAAKQRRAQTTAIAEIIRSIESPVIAMGDFNAWVEHDEIRSLLDSGMIDSWSAAGAGPGYSRPAQPHGEPLERIDLILVSPEIQPQSISVIDNELSRQASDHLPVVAEVSIQLP